MSHIDWKSLPIGIRQHLADRSRIRQLTKQDLLMLMEWVLSNPEVPDGD